MNHWRERRAFLYFRNKFDRFILPIKCGPNGNYAIKLLLNGFCIRLCAIFGTLIFKLTSKRGVIFLSFPPEVSLSWYTVKPLVNRQKSDWSAPGQACFQCLLTCVLKCCILLFFATFHRFYNSLLVDLVAAVNIDILRMDWVFLKSLVGGAVIALFVLTRGNLFSKKVGIRCYFYENVSFTVFTGYLMIFFCYTLHSDGLEFVIVFLYIARCKWSVH